MRKIVLNKEALFHWFQWTDQLVTILFTAFACSVDLRVGLFFTGYELVRAIYLQIQAEEKLIEEVEHEKHTYL
jgi:non-ribosomal peptide synthetase component F